MAIKKCKQCGMNISAPATVCPNCGKKYPTGGLTIPAKIFLVIVLLVIFGRLFNTPENSSKNDTSTIAPPRPTHTTKDTAMRAVKLDYKCSKSDIGILMADFSITNNSASEIKDIEITCEHYGKSGTKIDSNKRTIYDIIPAYETKFFNDFNMGFVHSQAHSTVCRCTGLKIVQ